MAVTQIRPIAQTMSTEKDQINFKERKKPMMDKPDKFWLSL